MLTMDKARGTSTWGRTVLSWVNPPAPHRVVLRYEDLVRDPRGSAREMVNRLGLGMSPLAGAVLPSFADLHEVDPRFFRRGRTRTYRDQLPPDLHRLFWSRPENGEAMAILGHHDAPTGTGMS
jgi:hypothetical protein